MLGHEVTTRYRIVDHDCRDDQNLMHLGSTKRGIPVRINKVVAQSQIKILTGLIAPHQVAGFSGGTKSLALGVSQAETIARLHSSRTQSEEPAMGTR